LLFITIKQRPSNAKAPPSLYLFNASHFSPPNERTNDSKRKLNGSQPVYGGGERRRDDLVAPLLYPPKVRGQSRWG